MLPCTLWGEKAGTVTNLEGPRAAGRPQGRARGHRDGRLAHRGASSRCGSAPTSTSRPSTRSPTRSRASRRRSPASTAALLRAGPRRCRAARWREHRDEIVLRTRELSILADDGSGTSWDPIKVEGEAAAEPARGRGCARPSRGEVATDGRPRPSCATGTAARRRSRCPRATRTLCASWWVARLYDDGRMVSEARGAASGSSAVPRCASARATAPRLGRRVRRVRSRSPPTAARSVVAVAVRRRRARGHRALDFSADGSGAAELIDVDAAGHRPARGDAAMSHLLLAVDPLFAGHDVVVGVRPSCSSRS